MYANIGHDLAHALWYANHDKIVAILGAEISSSPEAWLDSIAYTMLTPPPPL